MPIRLVCRRSPVNHGPGDASLDPDQSLGCSTSPRFAAETHDEGLFIRRKKLEHTRTILRQAIENSGRLTQPKEAESLDSKVQSYEGWNDVMRVLVAVHDITSTESMLPALDGFLIDRGCISHRKKTVRRPVIHLLFTTEREKLQKYQAKVALATANVVTAEKGLMLRVHSTVDFLLDYRKRLSSLYPVYMTIDVKGLCPSVLQPSRIRRVMARFRHPIKGYGQYPAGPGWE